MRDKLDNEKKDYLKKEDNERKKEKACNLDDDEKDQLRKYEKKRKKVMRDNLDNEKKEDSERKKERLVTWTIMRKIS